MDTIAGRHDVPPHGSALTATVTCPLAPVGLLSPKPIAACTPTTKGATATNRVVAPSISRVRHPVTVGAANRWARTSTSVPAAAAAPLGMGACADRARR